MRRWTTVGGGRWFRVAIRKVHTLSYSWSLHLLNVYTQFKEFCGALVLPWASKASEGYLYSCWINATHNWPTSCLLGMFCAGRSRIGRRRAVQVEQLWPLSLRHTHGNSTTQDLYLYRPRAVELLSSSCFKCGCEVIPGFHHRCVLSLSFLKLTQA